MLKTERCILSGEQLKINRDETGHQHFRGGSWVTNRVDQGTQLLFVNLKTPLHKTTEARRYNKNKQVFEIANDEAGIFLSCNRFRKNWDCVPIQSWVGDGWLAQVDPCTAGMLCEGAVFHGAKTAQTRTDTTRISRRSHHLEPTWLTTF